jgi:GTP-binding protein
MAEEERFMRKKKDLVLGNVQLPQDASEEGRLEFDKKAFLNEQRVADFKSQFKNVDELFLGDDVRVPEILYLANKSENGFEGDLLSDFYTMFPSAATEMDSQGKPVEPIFVSAEHGDGLPDLFQALKKRIPTTHFMVHDERKKKRVERFHEYKQMLLDEFVETKGQEIEAAGVGEEEEVDEVEANDLETLIHQWNKDFDRLNPDPEENSDFDSDNDINPLDTLTSAGKYTSSKAAQISSENALKKKPLQLALVGRPNVGKSTLVNGLLRENRVIANDLAGTTRDSVTVQWTFGGRRVNLVDTAGIKPGSRVKTEVDAMVGEQVTHAINYAHVVICLIDSMEAFTSADMVR